VHQARHALATDPNTMLIRQLSTDVRRAVGVARAAVDRSDLGRQRQILTPPTLWG
jgi:hypothetical protein